MDDLFTDKMKSFLNITGFSGNVNKIDFSFLTECQGFSDWFLTSTSENYITEEELKMVEQLKKENRFVESEKELDEILLKEYGINVNDECISDFDIDYMQYRISEIDESIDSMEKLEDLSKLHLQDAVNVSKNLNLKLAEEEEKFNDSYSKHAYYNNEFNCLFDDINKTYLNIFQQHVAGRKQENDLMLWKNLPVEDSKIIDTKKILMELFYIFNQNLNLRSKASSGSDMKKLLKDLAVLQPQIKDDFFQKIRLEVEEKVLLCYIQQLKDARLHRMPFFEDFFNDSVKYEDDPLESLLEKIEEECSNYADTQITIAVNKFYENKIIWRENKLKVITEYLNKIQSYCSLIDFLWMIVKKEKEFCDVYLSSISSLVNIVKSDYNNFLKVKESLKSWMSERVIESLDFSTVDKVENDENFPSSKQEIDLYNAKNTILESQKKVQLIFFESQINLEVLLKSLLSFPNHNATLLEDFKVLINITSDFKTAVADLNSRIHNETEQVIAKKVNLSNNKFQNQLTFLWVEFLLNPEKMLEICQNLSLNI